MNRGSRHQAIFADDSDRAAFLALLGRVTPRYGLEVHAYALMGNHFHLLIRSLRGRLSRGMRELQQTWTQTVNRRHDWDGPLFRSRFRSQLVTDERYLHTVLAYLHNNPVKAGLAPAAHLAAWTSHRAYLGLEPAPPWLHTAELLGWFGGRTRLAEQVGALSDLPDDIAHELLADLSVAGPLVGQTLARPPDLAAPLELQPVLDRIEAITGADLDALRVVRRGAGANAARRFAVWALRRATDLSQSEIGQLLSMSPRHVQNVEAALRRGWKAPIPEWASIWLAGGPFRR